MITKELLELFLTHKSVSTDTRNIPQGCLFFALKGDRFDGNAFIMEALQKGASYAIADNPELCDPTHKQIILVENSLIALQQLARAYRRTFDIPVLGITGSNGKTTTKELIYAAIQVEQKVFATQGNFNNYIGVPLSLLAIPSDTEIAIIEMGTNQPGDIQELVEIAEPTHALITNIGKAHLEKLGSLEGVADEKGALFTYVQQQKGVVFINKQDPFLKVMGKSSSPTITYGDPTATFSLAIEENLLRGMRVRIRKKGWQDDLLISSQLSGNYNALNLLAAVAVGDYFGVSKAAIKQGLEGYVSTNNRSQIIEKDNYTIWMDAYNANPGSMRASIQNIFQFKGEKIALILGDMFELGKNSQKLHEELGRFINSCNPKITIGVGERMKNAIDQISSPTQWYPDTQLAKQEVSNLVEGASLILIKGSRGMALEKLLEEL